MKENDNLEKAKSDTNEEFINKNNPVTLHYNKNNEPDGILIRTLDEEFVLNLQDTVEGRKTTFIFSKAVSLQAFNIKQAKIISLYIDEIQSLLSIYGSPLCGAYWTSTENKGYAWYLHSSGELYSTLDYYDKYERLLVRSVFNNELG